MTTMPVYSVPPIVSAHLVHATECLAGGTLAFLLRLTRELDALGVAQTLVYSRRPDTVSEALSQFPASVRLIEVPPAVGLHVRHAVAMARALRQAIRSRPTQGVHFHSSKAGFVGRLALCVGYGRLRLFYSPHGLSFLNRRKRFASLVYRILEGVVGRVRCQAIGCSEGEARLLERVTRRPACVLENPVAEEFFGVARDETAPPVVLSVGRACEQKAPEVFADLAVQFQIQETPVRFVWVGAGENARESQLRASGVEVTGWVGSEDVVRRMGQATIYVQTSRWEGLPLSVIQAMAAGLPCVVTDVVGNRDAILHGRTGFVAASFDELGSYVALLLRHRELRERMGAAARREALARFGPARFRQSVLALYGIEPEPVALPVSIAPTTQAVVADARSQVLALTA